MHRVHALLLAVTAPFLLNQAVCAQTAPQDDRFAIELRSRVITPGSAVPGPPEPLAPPAVAPGKPHVIVQLFEPPGRKARQKLEKHGVRLLSYLDGNAYFAVITPEARERWRSSRRGRVLSLVHWVGEIRPADRVEPEVLEGRFGDWAVNDDGTVTIRVVFFEDVAREAQLDLLERIGSGIEEVSPHTWQLDVQTEAIDGLAGEDPIRWIEQEPAPADPANDATRAALGVDAVQAFDSGTATYGGFTGAGIQVLIRDSGIEAHPDLAGRILSTNTPSLTYEHGTGMAGIVGGSGVHSNQPDSDGNPNGGTAYQWRGMAPGVQFVGRPFGWERQVYADAIDDWGVDISSNSQHQRPYTQYATVTREVDELVRSRKHYLVAAAGNMGSSPVSHDDSGNEVRPWATAACYYSITGTPAKNALSVGNWDKRPTRLRRSASSSIGPTFDGRIKPDLMAPGTRARTTAYKDGYGFRGGTSSATAATSGVVVLMLEAYCDERGISCDFDGDQEALKPRFSTIKAVLIQTAEDLDQDPGPANEPCLDFSPRQAAFYHAGPDWATGYGLIHAGRAVETITDWGRIREDEIPYTGRRKVFTMEVEPGRTQLRATLVWDDAPASENSGQTAPKLVNDLDLRLFEPRTGTEHRPWVLAPLDPGDDCRLETLEDCACGNDADCRDVANDCARTPECGIDPKDIQAAGTGDDRLNNVEQVFVANPTPGLWGVRVTGGALRAAGGQPFSLVADTDLVDPWGPSIDLEFRGGLVWEPDYLPPDPPDHYLLEFLAMVRELVRAPRFPRWQIGGAVGFYSVPTAATGGEGADWWKVSAELRYRLSEGRTQPYLTFGPGAYFEDGDSAKVGFAAGLGFSRSLGSRWGLVFDARFHYVDASPNELEFVTTSVGLRYGLGPDG